MNDAAMMRPRDGAAPEQGAGDRAWLWQWAGFAILVGVLLFNPFLAIANAHAHPIGAGAVAGVQGLLVLAAFALGLSDRHALPLRWLVLAWGLLLLFLLLSMLRSAVEPKYFGDVLVIPAFIALGMRLEEATLIRAVLVMQVLLALIGAWELLAPDSFGAVFSVARYYVATRGLDESAFWADNGLFVSSERPGGRLLMAFTGWHRGSSLFLEPVSLGNWTILATLFILAFWRKLGWIVRILLIACNIWLLVVCDGRLALIVSLLFVLVLPLSYFIPGWISAAYLPVVMLGVFLARAGGLLDESGDNFAGRLHYGIDALTSLSLPQLLAYKPGHIIADSGWVYMIQTQSLIVMIAIWAMITLTPIGEDWEGRVTKHGIALFIALTLPISYSVFSVKTAALMWALYGVLFARSRQAEPPTQTVLPPLWSSASPLSWPTPRHG